MLRAADIPLTAAASLPVTPGRPPSLRLMAVAVITLALAACGPKEAPPRADEPVVNGQTIAFPASMRAASGIASERVASGGERVLTLPGRLAWNEDRTVRVASPFAGRVTAMLVEPGATVRAGQPLATLASADFGAAQADVRKAAAEAAVASKALARQRELYDAGIVAQKELEQVQAEAARASAELQRSQGALRQYDAGAAAPGDRAGTGFALRSPIAGVVVERNLNPGMEVRPDQQGAPLFLVTDPTTLWAQLDAAESDLKLFRPGVTVSLTTAAYPDERFPATVVKVADYVDPAARSIKVRLSVPNADRRLKAEMFVTAKLQAAAFAGIAVPEKAVFLADNRNYVFVRTAAATFERRQVKLGASLPGTTEVTDGLHDGDAVVTDGNLYLQDILRDATAVADARAAQAGLAARGGNDGGKEGGAR